MHVVFGKADLETVETSEILAGSGGFSVPMMHRGRVASAGDMNDDGAPDLAISLAGAAAPNGSIYVVYGKADTASVDYAMTMVLTVGVTTVVWLAVTFLTPPESEATLERFYRRVRPGGAGWRPVSERLGYGPEPIPGGALSWLNWAAGVIAVYAAVFAVGALLTGWLWRGVVYGIASIVAFSLIYRNLRADPTLDMSVDRGDSASLALMPDRTGS